ncbi:hypothetical protein, partial [Latilactobacillus curvatus]
MLKHTSALNQIYQIGDCITYSANPVNAQSITVSNALCLETCLLKHTSALNQIYQIGDCITYSA